MAGTHTYNRKLWICCYHLLYNAPIRGLAIPENTNDYSELPPVMRQYKFEAFTLARVSLMDDAKGEGQF